MAKFHYLVAQLPTLFFDRDPGISVADFLREAEKWMSESEFEVFSGIRFDDPVVSETEPELLRAYREFEFDLRTRQRVGSGRDVIRLDRHSLFLSGNHRVVVR